VSLPCTADASTVRVKKLLARQEVKRNCTFVEHKSETSESYVTDAEINRVEIYASPHPWTQLDELTNRENGAILIM
jgi:hypothetical protein